MPITMLARMHNSLNRHLSALGYEETSTLKLLQSTFLVTINLDFTLNSTLKKKIKGSIESFSSKILSKINNRFEMKLSYCMDIEKHSNKSLRSQTLVVTVTVVELSAITDYYKIKV